VHVSFGRIAQRHPTLSELEAARTSWPASARTRGTVELIVVRPERHERKCPSHAELTPEHGLVGDHWGQGKRNMSAQITLMDARVAAALGSREDWPLFGDNFILDFDLAIDRLPEGSIVALGEARLEVTSEPHLGCKKFSARFGDHAMHWVNDKTLRPLRLRGINTRIVAAGRVRVGDVVQVESL
jgi:MOSC domain-containing protein YiiM